MIPRSLIILALLGLSLSGCSATSDPIPGAVPATAVLETGDPEGPAPDPTWNGPSETAAIRTAQNAVGAWISTADADEALWRGRLSAWLSPEAMEYYGAVDPRNIAPGSVTGGRLLSTDGPASLATVEVTTTSGRYEVLLNRFSGSEPWKTQRITEAQG